jgi:hypothetical protein
MMQSTIPRSLFSQTSKRTRSKMWLRGVRLLRSWPSYTPYHMGLPTSGWKKRSPSKTSEPLLFPIINDQTLPSSFNVGSIPRLPRSFSWQTWSDARKTMMNICECTSRL